MAGDDTPPAQESRGVEQPFAFGSGISDMETIAYQEQGRNDIIVSTRDSRIIICDDFNFFSFSREFTNPGYRCLDHSSTAFSFSSCDILFHRSLNCSFCSSVKEFHFSSSLARTEAGKSIPIQARGSSG